MAGILHGLHDERDPLKPFAEAGFKVLNAISDVKLKKKMFKESNPVV
jgi:hypothetical protein